MVTGSSVSLTDSYVFGSDWEQSVGDIGLVNSVWILDNIELIDVSSIQLDQGSILEVRQVGM